MARLTIKKQINEIEEAENFYPEHQKLVDLYKSILQILLSIEESSITKAEKYFTNEELVEIKKKVLSSKKPIKDFFNKEFLPEINLYSLIHDVVQCILEKGGKAEAIEKLLTAIKTGELNVYDGIKAVIQEDSDWFRKIGDEYGIDDASLIYIFSKPLQPFYEELARIFENDFKDKWSELFSPVCGRTSMIVRVKDTTRFMTCTYCGTEYRIDRFVCQHCGNKDPNSLGFISFEDNKEYELDYCEQCNQYIKIIYEDRIKKKIPKGLEDTLTQHLDSFIREQKHSLKRV